MDEQNQGGQLPQNVPPQPNPYTNNPAGDMMPPQQIVQPGQQPVGIPPQGPLPGGSYPEMSSSDNNASPTGLQPGQLPPNDEAAKKKKKLFIIIAAAVGFVFVLLIAVVVFFGGGNDPTDTSPKLTKRYDSPLAIAAPFQSQDVKNGAFKLTANYITGGDFTKEGTFFTEDGRLYFEMLPDDTKVNEFIRDLYIKQGKQADYVEKFQGATRNFRYDFMSFLGYQYLSDVNLPNGFIPTVEAARDNPTLASQNKALRLGRDCNAALSELKAKINDKMQITDGLEFDLSREGIRTKAVVSFATRKSVDAAIIRFLENCYDQSKPEAAFYKTFTESLKQNVTSSPTFITWEQGGNHIVEIRDMPANASFGGTMKFEVSKINQATSGKIGETASYAERRNHFGLAFSYCHIEPVVTTTIAEGYRLLKEDTLYGYPAQDHSGYYCTTAQVPSEYEVAAKMTLRLDNALIEQVDKTKYAALKSVHDLEYHSEKYKIDNKRYPNGSEFIDMVNNNLGVLTVDAQKVLSDKSLLYIADPAQCIGNCTSYTLSYQYAPKFKISRYPY